MKVHIFETIGGDATLDESGMRNMGGRVKMRVNQKFSLSAPGEQIKEG